MRAWSCQLLGTMLLAECFWAECWWDGQIWRGQPMWQDFGDGTDALVADGNYKSGRLAETAGRPDVVYGPLVCWTCGYCPVWGGRWLDVDDLDAVAAVGSVAGEIVQSVLAGNEERQYEEAAWWQDGNQH